MKNECVTNSNDPTNSVFTQSHRLGQRREKKLTKFRSLSIGTRTGNELTQWCWQLNAYLYRSIKMVWNETFYYGKLPWTYGEESIL